MKPGRTIDFLKELPRAGWRMRLKRLNDIVRRLNPLLSITVIEKNGVKSAIQYSQNSIVLTIQAYQDQIDALEARVTALEARVTTNETDIADHETRITALEGP